MRRDYRAQFGSGELSFLKTIKSTPSNPAKEKFLKEFQGAIDELKQIKAGKKKARNAEDFLNEL